MSNTIGTSGFGTKLYRSDGGVGAGVKASKTFGSTNQQVKYEADYAGVAGNGIQIAHINGGVSQPLTISVSGTSITVNLATDGSSVVTSTASDVIDLVNSTPAAAALVFATNGVGNGSGLAVVGALGALSGGAAGVEMFVLVAEITNISGPDEKLELIDATHMESPGGRREFIPSLKDSGEISLDVNFLPGSATQEVLRSDLSNSVRSKYALVWSDVAQTTYAFLGYVTMHSKTAKIDDKLTASCTIKVTGDITKTAGGVLTVV